MSTENLHAQRQKRALNIVWTAAGRYDFRPAFLSFYADGEPDLYLNSIVGLVHRHYDAEKLTAYLQNTLDKSLLGELFAELFWLGLEVAAYEKELPARPVLASLRRQHAARFLREDVDLSFQQLMMRQELAHNLKCARCREILGGKPELLNPWDRKLYKALQFTGQMSTEEIIDAMERIIKRFFRFHWYGAPRKALHFSLSPRLKALLHRILPLHSRYGEDFAAGLLLPVSGEADCGEKSFWPGAKVGRRSEAELSRLYGEPLFSQERLSAIEGKLCRGIHRHAQLWFTREAGEMQRENWEFFQQQQMWFRTEVRELTRRLQNALLVHRQPMELPARSGRLAPGRVWRGVKLQDSRVFTATEKASYADFSVMLLLDASDSRQGRQMVIATQAYLLAEALGQAGIRLAAAAFFSQGSCTILRLLKGFDDSSSQGIFAYKAQGWNRDGLALRAVPELWGEIPGRKLLFILTDADPSDEQPIPAEGIGTAKIYGGLPAREDAAKGVKYLKVQGFAVMALINSVISAELVTEAAGKIYGSSYIHLQDLSHMASKVGDMLEKEIFSHNG